MTQIYLNTPKLGLTRALQLLEVGGSFLISDIAKATHIQAGVASVNRKRIKRGVAPIRIRQERHFLIEPKNGASTAYWLVTRTE